MKTIRKEILEGISQGKAFLAVLIDPEKFDVQETNSFLEKIPRSTSHLFIGGSTVASEQVEICARTLRGKTELPIVLFPGDHSHITSYADGVLFLSLLSGRNPDYLIGQQVRSVEVLRSMNLEIIATGYVLIDGGEESAVQRVTGTVPIARDNIEEIVNTALAGEFSGKAMIYLEAGSGAKYPVSPETIRAVKKVLSVPLIVGGGIRSTEQLSMAYGAGADLVVVGTAFEQENFFI